MNPRNHPNGYVALSSGAVATFLVHEAKQRLGFDLSLDEASFLVTAVVSVFLFTSRRIGKAK